MRRPLKERYGYGTQTILVVGAGDATGGAIARRFAREGLVACVTRRSADKLEPLVAQIQAEGGEAHGFALRRAQGSRRRRRWSRTIEREIAPIEVAVFNIGANVRFGIARDDRARLSQGLGDGRARPAS